MITILKDNLLFRITSLQHFFPQVSAIQIIMSKREETDIATEVTANPGRWIYYSQEVDYVTFVLQIYTHTLYGGMIDSSVISKFTQAQSRPQQCIRATHKTTHCPQMHTKAQPFSLSASVGQCGNCTWTDSDSPTSVPACLLRLTVQNWAGASSLDLLCGGESQRRTQHLLFLHVLFWIQNATYHSFPHLDVLFSWTAKPEGTLNKVYQQRVRTMNIYLWKHLNLLSGAFFGGGCVVDEYYTYLFPTYF